MTPVDKLTQAISRFEAKASPHLDEQVREHVYEAFANAVSTPAAWRETSRWRLIAGSRVAQLAAAAVIVLAAFLGLHMGGLGGSEVYAVEQTIDALRNIETAHAFCTGWQGEKFEIWLKPNPATGANDFICLTEANEGSVMISTPYVSYNYFPAGNFVRVVRGQQLTSNLDPARTIESLMQEAGKRGDSVEIGRKLTDRHGEVLTLRCTGPTREFEAWIDPKTKLLLGLECTRTSEPGEIVKSMDEIRYNEPVPERLLRFECPENMAVTLDGWGNLDDPNAGIDATGLSDEQACRTILTQLFEAVNARNLDGIRRLIPAASQWDDETLISAVWDVVGKHWDDPMPGVMAYEIGAPYRDRSCPLGVLVPCVLTDHNSQRFQLTLIVRFREAEERRSCVIVDAWDGLKPRLGPMQKPQPARAPNAPFQGPINAAGLTSRTTVLIVPTNEPNETTEAGIHRSVQAMQKFIATKAPERSVNVMTDVEALATDLSQSCLFVYGTPAGNLWLAKHITALPVVIEPNSITADRVYEGSDLRFITAWPNPQNPNIGIVIYTAQRGEDIIAINRVYHGPTDFLVARGDTLKHSGDYVKKNGRWTFR